MAEITCNQYKVMILQGKGTKGGLGYETNAPILDHYKADLIILKEPDGTHRLLKCRTRLDFTPKQLKTITDMLLMEEKI